MLCRIVVLTALCLGSAPGISLAGDAIPGSDSPKAVIIAGPKSHGPVGNGMHDYGWSAKLLKVMLDNSNVADALRVEIHLDGWPEDASTLDDAATIMVISDGRDGQAFDEAPHLASPENIALVQKQIDRGCGFLTFHFSTFAPDAYARQILDWSGGYFDWETDGERKWYSNIQTLDAAVQPATPDHPVLSGVGPFTVHEEFYFDLRLASDANGIVPVWTVPALPGREPDGRVVAWARERVNGGRGFGTTGGHFYANWESPEFRRTILNALAWTAKVDVPPGGVDAAYYTPAEITAALAGITGTGRARAKPKSNPQPPLSASRPAPLADGRFNTALNAHAGALFLQPRPELAAPPLTAELWARLERRGDYNILLANESKASATHWEIFTHPGNGRLTVYVPGLVPDHVQTEADIVDGEWHYVAMQYAPDHIRLFVDGKLVGDQPVAPATANVLPQIPGEFGIGSLVSRKLGCGGLIDDVRISRGQRDVSRIPDTPHAVDEQTTALWRFDQLADNQVVDATGAAAATWESSTTARGTPVSFQRRADQDSIDWAQGFLWADEQSREDDRWNQMQIGRALASIVQFGSGPVAKGLSIRLGEPGNAAVCYDTERMCVRAGWTGDFLKFDPTRFGLINPPAPAGNLQFESPPVDGWTGGEIAYRGQYRHNERVLLEFTVGGTRVLESPWSEPIGRHMAFIRSLQVAPHDSALTLQIGKFGGARIVERNGKTFAVCGQGDRAVCVAIIGAPPLAIGADGLVTATLAASPESTRFDVLIWRGAEQSLPACANHIAQRAAPDSLDSLLAPGELLWPETLATHGTRGEDDEAYTVDTVAVPFDNPYQALIFTSGFDFLTDGRAAVSAIHGDVWLVDGLDADLDSVTWKRFATGLFQPLGVRIINDEIYVLGRDQITRLHDRNGDGEADYYESFCNGYLTSTGGHDYVACLETDPQGNFYFTHGVDGVLRVPPTGGTATAIATGLRNPNGLGVGPQGLVTAAPQEGTWTPVSNIVVVRDGDHFGFGGPRVTDSRPLGYDPPLCWIPRLLDNSSGGQVWATGNRWGPLSGQMLHLSFGQCRALLTLMEQVDGRWQGGTVSLPWNFQSGVMRGRVHPLDGQVWVSGLKGWTTRAVNDGCLQRIRYTGQPVYLPTEVETYANGIALTFTAPLDPKIAQDPDSYHAEQWNYLWSQAYGSADYKPSAPGIEGHDPVEIVSATLQPDGTTVFLEIEDLAPVMQLRIDYQLRASDGHEFSDAYYHTVNRLPATRVPDSQIVRVPRQRLPAEIESSLKPGVLVRYTDDDEDQPGLSPDEDLASSFCRVERLAAFNIANNEVVSSLMLRPVARLQARIEGYVRTPLRGDYTFSFDGCGAARLEINGEEVLTGHSNDLAAPGGTNTRLRTGYNAVRIDYLGPVGEASRFRLLWQHESFPREPVPPTAWFHRSDDPGLQELPSWRKGRELFAALHCDRCHLAAADRSDEMPELSLDPPNLFGSGARLHRDWVTSWLINPKSHRPQATMPALFDPTDSQTAQHAADVAAYVATLGVEPANVSRETFRGTEPREVAEAAEAIETGERLYEQLACLACHRFTPPDAPDDYDRVSLVGVGGKYRPGRLAEYLRAPQRHHLGTRMPDFQLSTEEADALAALINSKGPSGESDAAPPVGDPERGRKHFDAMRCAACHQASAMPQSETRAPEPIPLADTRRGCLASSAADPGTAPQFHLDQGQWVALHSFIRFGTDHLEHDSPSEAAERLIRQFNCAACHSRDNDVSPRQFLTVDEGSGMIPDALPTLTWTGEKLRTDWLARFFAGDRHGPLRPWLKARMPAFPAIAHVLADGLRAQHGIAADDPEPFAPDADVAAIGARLAAPAALDCKQCHGVGAEEPRGDKQTLIALGVNFSDSRQRLRRDYYDRFVLNPPRCDPGLRMPILAPDGRTTKVTKVFGGDAAKQFDALWHYLQSAPPRISAESATSE